MKPLPERGAVPATTHTGQYQHGAGRRFLGCGDRSGRLVCRHIAIGRLSGFWESVHLVSCVRTVIRTREFLRIGMDFGSLLIIDILPRAGRVAHPVRRFKTVGTCRGACLATVSALAQKGNVGTATTSTVVRIAPLRNIGIQTNYRRDIPIN